MRIFLHASTAHCLDQDNRRPAGCYLMCHPIELLQKYGNINPFPIDYGFRPRLRDRLTPGRRTLPGKPSVFGVEDSYLHFRYSCLHPLLCYLQRTSRRAFTGFHNACLPRKNRKGFCTRSFGTILSSVTLSAHDYLTSELLRTLSRDGCF